MKKLFLIIFCVFVFLSVYSSSIDSKISGTFNNTLLVDFIDIVESNSGLVFFYDANDIDSVYITASGINMDIDSLLKHNLRKVSMRYYVTPPGEIVLYRGGIIIETIPNYLTVDGDNKYVLKKENKNRNVNPSINKAAKGEDLLTVGKKADAISGQVNYIRGRVIEEATGEPLIGATIYVEELKSGVVTDLDGYFNIPLNTGKFKVKVNSLSMKEKKFYLQVYSGGNISIQLEKEVMSLNEVRITADKNDNVKGMQMGFSRMTSKSIKEIPVVMGEKDLLKIAQMLPGVQSSGEGSSGINVRGGTADQNLFYINKVPIYNTAHLFGFFTAFSPDIVSDFSLYKSNIPAKYGGRVSSVFDITTRQGNKKKFFSKGGISPITGHISAEGPIVKDVSSFVVSYRGTYSDWILSKIDDPELQNSSASFYDFSANVNIKINDDNYIKAFGYYSSDEFSLSVKDDYDYSNIGGSISWKHFFSPKLNGDFSMVMSQYGFGHNSKSNISTAHRQEYRLNHNEVKFDILYSSLQNHKMSMGGSGILYSLDRGTILPYGSESNILPIELGSEKGIESALYFSDEFILFPSLTVLAGVRLSNFLFLGPQEVNEYLGDDYDEEDIVGTKKYGSNEIIKSYYSIEPRVALNYMLGVSNSIKASYNRASQNIFMLSNTYAISPTDQWKLADYYIKPPVANQFSLGYYHNFPSKGIETSIEAYSKQTNNVVEYRDGADFISGKPVEMLLEQGKQNGYGVEFMAKKNTGKVTGWLSYAYSKSTISIDGMNPYPSNYDKPHSLNVVSNFRVNRRVSFSTNVVYSTGRPVTYPVALYYSEGQEFVAYSDRNEYRIPDYFRVDFSINLEGNLNEKKLIHSSWMLNVYNLTGRKNAYSVYFEHDEYGNMQGYKMSIFGQPVVTLSWNFKFGNYDND